MPKVILFPVHLLLLSALAFPLLARGQVSVQATPTKATSSPASPSEQAVSSNATAELLSESWVFPKELHPWSRFHAGSWREIKIVTETFDEQGRLSGRSVTTQKEILKSTTDKTYVITVQTSVDVAGKRIQGPWNTRVSHVSTDGRDMVFSTSQRPDEILPQSVGEVECHVFEVQYADENRHMRDQVFFSPDVFPHVLRRDTFEKPTTTSGEDLPERSVTTLALSIPLEWEGGIISCASQEKVLRHAKGHSQTITLLSPVVPGGEIRSHSTEFDASGRRIRWSVQKLVAYGTTHITGTTLEASAMSIPANREQK